MNISPTVLEKIRAEVKLHHFEEFGGYLIVENNTITDVIFDVDSASAGYVKLGLRNILKLPEDQQAKVRGWFHRHPIIGLSQMDIHTMLDLTDFWNECYTLVLQSNHKLLLIHTIKGLDIIFRQPTIIEVETSDTDLYPYNAIPVTTKIFSWTRKAISNNPEQDPLFESPEINKTPTYQPAISDDPKDPLWTPVCSRVPPTSAETIKCPYCEKDTPAHEKYCKYCGTNLKNKKQKFGKGFGLK